MIVCRTLGGLEVTLAGDPPPAELTWRKHLALLIYLARSPLGRTREHLAGLLWADRPAASARHSLNVALHTVRRHAGGASIEADGNAIRLAPGIVRLDVNELDAFVGRADWRAAARLVRGEFMEGFSLADAPAFEAWLSAERETWRQRSVEALVSRGEQLAAGGHAREALAVALRAAALDPSSEIAARTVMRASVLAGHAEGGLEHYRAFDRLAARNGAGPGPELAALASRVRAECRVRRDGASDRRATAEGRLPPIGREAELQRLLEALSSARATPRASALIVEGAVGMGKTSMLNEVLVRARLEGMAVILARPIEDDAGDAWSGALALARGGLVEAAGAAGPAPGALAAFAGMGPAGAEPATVRAGAPAWALGPALGELLRAAAESQPVLLAVDDAQWLDRESLLALVAALRGLTPLPAALILGLDPVAWRAEVEELRALLGPELGGVSVTLSALGQGPLHALARRLVPRSTGSARDGLVRRVAEVSGGTPGLAVALFRAVLHGLDLGAIATADAAPEAIRMSYRRLSPEAQRVLGAASVLAGRTSSARLARALDADPEAVRGALDELRCEQWLVAEPRGYGFVAADARQIIQREMVTLGRRNRLLQNDAAPWPA